MLSLLQTGIPGGPELIVIFLILMLLIILPLTILVPAFVYRDASGRNSDHALAWAMGAFFGGVIVWVLYVVVRDEIGDGNSS